MTASLARRSPILLKVQRRFEARAPERSATTTHVGEMLKVQRRCCFFETTPNERNGKGRITPRRWQRRPVTKGLILSEEWSGPPIADL